MSRHPDLHWGFPVTKFQVVRILNGTGPPIHGEVTIAVLKFVDRFERANLIRLINNLLRHPFRHAGQCHEQRPAISGDYFTSRVVGRVSQSAIVCELQNAVWLAGDKNEANEVETERLVILVIIILTEHQFFTTKSTVLRFNRS